MLKATDDMTYHELVAEFRALIDATTRRKLTAAERMRYRVLYMALTY